MWQSLCHRFWWSVSLSFGVLSFGGFESKGRRLYYLSLRLCRIGNSEQLRHRIDTLKETSRMKGLYNYLGKR